MFNNAMETVKNTIALASVAAMLALRSQEACAADAKPALPQQPEAQETVASHVHAAQLDSFHENLSTLGPRGGFYFLRARQGDIYSISVLYNDGRTGRIDKTSSGEWYRVPLQRGMNTILVVVKRDSSKSEFRTLVSRYNWTGE